VTPEDRAAAGVRALLPTGLLRRPTPVIVVAFALLGLTVQSVDAIVRAGRIDAYAASAMLGRMALWAVVYPLVFQPWRRRFAARPPRLGWGTFASIAVLSAGSAVLMEVVVGVATSLPKGETLDWLVTFFTGRMPVALFLPALLTHGAALVELGFATAAHARGTLLRVERMRARQREARLHLLRNQLHPHFLFNALQGVSALLGKEPEEAERLLGRLQSLYRHSLQSLHSTSVPLRDEIEWSREYLEIERARFSDRLQVRTSVADDVAAASVPPLILQPLVENAVRHGIARERGPGWIAISAVREEGQVLLRVANGISRPQNVAFGFGLRHTTRRLRETYGEAARLEVAQSPTAIEFVLRLPLETRPSG
jgi:signal transduction histidine kinase